MGVLHETLAIDSIHGEEDIVALLYGPAQVPRAIAAPRNSNVVLQAGDLQAVCSDSKGSDFMIVADHVILFCRGDRLGERDSFLIPF